MRAIWSYAGLMLAVAAAALLIVPGFLDWSRYAGAIEEQAEALTGRDVTIAGDVRISMLPSPRLTLGELTIANIEGGSSPEMFRSQSMSAELSVGALFRGEVTISRLTLASPRLLLEETGDGRRNWDFTVPSDAPAVPTPVSVRAIAVLDGEVAIRAAGAATARRLTAIEAEVAVSDLRGPYRATGTARAGDMPFSFAAAVGAIAPDKAYPANASLTFAGGGLEVRGIVTGRGAEIRFDGAATGSVEPEVSPLLASLAAGQPVRLSAGVVAGPDAIELREVKAAGGQAELAGRIDIARGARLAVDADLALTRADLGGIESRGGKLDADALADATQTVLEALPGGTYRISVGEIRLASGQIGSVEIEAEAGGDTLSIARAQAVLPGDSRVTASGAVASGEEGPYFSGDAGLESGAGDALVSWLSGENGPDVLSAQPVIFMRGRSGVFLTRQRLSLDRLDVALGATEADSATAAGRFAVTFGARPAIAADLDIERLALPAPGPLLREGIVPGRRIDLGFDGTVALRAGRIDAGPVRLQDVLLNMEARGPAFTVSEFVFRSAQGASGTLSGSSDAQSGRFQATLTAPDVGALEGIAALPTHALDTLAPFSASANIAWPAQPPDQVLPASPETTAVSVLGRAGPVQIELDGFGAPGNEGLNDAAYDIAAQASAAAWPDLLRLAAAIAAPATQAAQPVPGGDDTAAANGEAAAYAEGSVSVVARGRIGRDTAIAGKADLGPLTATVEGSSPKGPQGGTHAYDVSVEVADMAALAAQGAPDLPLETLRAMGSLAWGGARLTVEDGRIDAADAARRIEVSLDGRADFAPDVPEVAADVEARTLDLGLALALLRHGLGRDVLADDTSPGGWGTGPFDLSWLDAVNGRMALTGDGIGAGAWRAYDVAANLTLAAGDLSVTNARGVLFGGEVRLSGSLQHASGAALSLDVAGRDMDLAQLGGALPFGEIGEGAVEIDMSLEGSGLSELALVSSLKGEGRLALRDGALAGLDLGALSEGLVSLDDLDGFAPLAAATLHDGMTGYGRIGGIFEVTAGVLRAPALAFSGPAASGTVGLFADAGRRAVDMEASFDLNTPAEAPAVQVVVAGQVGDTARTVNALALEAFAAQRILERDLDALVEGGGSEELRELLGLPEAGAAETATP